MKSLLASNYFKLKVWKFCPLFSAMILELCIIVLIVLPLGFVLLGFVYCSCSCCAQSLKIFFHWVLEGCCCTFERYSLISALIHFLVLLCFFSLQYWWHFISEVLVSLLTASCVNPKTNKHIFVVNKFRMKTCLLAIGRQMSWGGFPKRLATQETKWFQNDLPNRIVSWLPIGARSRIQLPVEVLFSPLFLIKKDFAIFN